MMEPDTEILLRAAIEISSQAVAIPLRHFRTNLAVENKTDTSPVTVADRETEEFITRAILERYPKHGILGEEFGSQGGDSPYTWVIDPIDGTKSFITGSPLFGMLIGLVKEGVPQLGVMQMPALGECFAGARGIGASLNGKAVRCRPAPPLASARLYLNEANLLLEREPDRFARLSSAGSLRRFAYDCYSFGLLTAGHIDAVVELDLQPHDYLPIAPIVEAAGGIMTDWRGNPLGLQSDGNVIAAGSAELHAELLELLA